MKKIVVTGTRGIPGVMGGVETHCEELFPRLAERGWDVTLQLCGGWPEGVEGCSARHASFSQEKVV